jgi:hypothetical protein
LITDTSSGNLNDTNSKQLVVQVFCNNLQDLPKIGKTGDVVYLHNVDIVRYKGTLFFPFFKFIVFLTMEIFLLLQNSELLFFKTYFTERLQALARTSSTTTWIVNLTDDHTNIFSDMTIKWNRHFSTLEEHFDLLHKWFKTQTEEPQKSQTTMEQITDEIDLFTEGMYVPLYAS